jgi:hypothetical protein
MLWLLLILIVLVVLFVYRVPILAKLTGQSPDRIKRALNRRKGG